MRDGDDGASGRKRWLVNVVLCALSLVVLFVVFVGTGLWYPLLLAACCLVLTWMSLVGYARHQTTAEYIDGQLQTIQGAYGLTPDELRQVLDAAAQDLEAVQNLLPPAAWDRLALLVTMLQQQDYLILTALQIVNPTLTKEDLDKNLLALQASMGAAKTLVQAGSLQKMADFCRRLERRPLLLRFIAKRL